MRKTKLLFISLIVAASLSFSSLQAAEFGEEDDVKYAAALWQALNDANLVGEKQIMSIPYAGQHPHGAVLETVETELTVNGETNIVSVKRNYGGEGVSKQTVLNDPQKYLKAVTVMYKRPGYDADTKDWFWAKYLADGSLDKNPKGVQLAGKVAKMPDGTSAGCIACHTAAPGGDFVFNHDRFK